MYRASDRASAACALVLRWLPALLSVASLLGAVGEEPAPVLSIPLQKQYVPISKDGKVVAYKTAYFGTVQTGGEEPRQNFTVVFDTGSGHLILPSTACHSETCTKHRRYSRGDSKSAVDIEYDGTLIRPDAVERDQVSIAFGTGQVLGEFVREVVCVGAGIEDQRAQHQTGDAAAAGDALNASEGGDEASNRSPVCMSLRLVLATEMTDDPFGLFAFDGVLGLGLEALTLAPEFSFFGQLAQQHPTVQPRFAVFLARTDGGESLITFGGHDERLASSELQWAPVSMQELGYWQVKVVAIRVGDTVVDDCADGQCRAILDTGTSLLGVPRQAARSMHKLLARQVPQESYADAASIDCRRIAGQDIRFELEGGLEVSLGIEDYSRPTPFNMTVTGANAWRLFCRSLLLPVDMPAPLGPKVFIWGEPVLRRYYTVYDWANKRVGFTRARDPQTEESSAGGAPSSSTPTRSRGLPPVGAPPPGSLISGAPLAPLAPEPPRTEPIAAAAAEGSPTPLTV